MNNLTVLAITKNEAHNIARFANSAKKITNKIIVLDSLSDDETVSLCKSFGILVLSRPFTNFSDQWNHLINRPEITTTHVMKHDPDEEISDQLADDIKRCIQENSINGFYVKRALFFQGVNLGIYDYPLRIWKHGSCDFPDMKVNEHPLVRGKKTTLCSPLFHYDSPNIHKWLEKQNLYTSLEAQNMKDANYARYSGEFSKSLNIRFFLKRFFFRLPFKFSLLFVYYYFWRRLVFKGRAGLMYAHLRVMVFRLRYYKSIELSQK